jgi:hypothetical protein
MSPELNGTSGRIKNSASVRKVEHGPGRFVTRRRKSSPALQELPPRLLALVEKLDASQGNQSPPEMALRLAQQVRRDRGHASSNRTGSPRLSSSRPPKQRDRA